MAFVPIRTIVGTDEEDTGFKPLRDVYLGPAPQRGAIAAGLSAGVDQLQGLGYSALGGVADIAGAGGVRDWANEQARRNQIDASVGGRPDLERIEDQTLGSALPYVGYQIAKQVPTMAGIAGAQLIPGAGQVAGAVGLTRLGAVAPRMLGGGGLEAGASIAARRAALAQGEAFGTGTLAGSAMGFGSLYGESVEGGDPSPFKALALAPLYGAAEAVLPAVLQGSLRAPARYSGNLGTRMAKAGGVAGAGESLTELGQNELEMGMRSDLTAEEMASRRLNAAAAGLIVGGSLGTVGGLRGPVRPDTESDLTQPLDTTTRPDSSQFVTQDQTVGLKKFIDETTGVVRPSRKDYAKQFEAAFDEPSGQFVADAATGVERELTVGELMQRGSAAMDLTQDKPADTAAAATAATNVATTRDPRDVFLRDTLKVTPNNNSRQLFTLMEAEGIDPTSPTMVPVWNYAAAKYMTPSRLVKATELMDAAIIESRKEAPSGTGISTVQQPAGGVGVGGPVVQGGLGDAGRPAPVAGTVVGGAPAAGVPLRETSVLPVTPGQPPAPVTTTAPAAAPAPETRFRRAPRPMTVLESARAAQAAQAQQTETQGQTTPAAAGPVVDERQAILQQIFGERDGNIIFDVVGMGMPEPEAATKYGLSRQSIQKIAGATGQKTWPERIAKAKAQFGLTDAQIADAFNTVAPDSTEGQIASQVFAQSQDRMDENEAIEAGLGNIVKTAGASTGAVEGFTKLQKEIDATLEALAVETDPAVLADLNAKLTAQIEKVKAVEKQAQAEVRALAGRKSDKETSEEAAAKAEQPAELGAEDAVQVESPAGVSVQPKAEAGQGVGTKVRRAKKPAAEGKAQVPAKVLTEAEQAAQAWDVVAADFPQAPKFADLTKAQQQDFIEFGPGNWERGDVELELTKLAKGGMKFGTEAAPTQDREPYTTKQLLAELKAFIRADIPKRKLMVVGSVADLLTSPDAKIRAVGAALQLQGAYGVAVDGRAFLIANRIKQGSGRAKFMHEVGGHLGLDNLLTKADEDKLVNQIKSWARKADGSLEAELALQAFERVQAAETPAKDRRSELIAYFIESAMEMGIDPTAATDTKLSGPLREWFRTLWAAFKVAARKLGIKPESMTAQDVVNLAYGAARLEINGTWHGTSAAFRNFRNKYIGSGEGATAYGWGTYLAQRVGIAKGYWSADVDRKTASPTATYDGRPVEEVLAKLDAKEFDGSGLTVDEESLRMVLSEMSLNLGVGDPNALRTTNMNIAKRGASGSFTSKSYKQASDWLDKNYSKFKVVPGKQPEGNLMRVDTAVDDDRVFNYDTLVIKQPNYVADKLMELLDPVADEILDRTNKDVEELTGRDLIGTGENDLGLLSNLIMDDALSLPAGQDKQFDEAVRQGKFHEAASHFLRASGIQGIKFYDARSRGSASTAISFDGKTYNRDELRDKSREASQANDSAKTMQFLMLRDILRNGVDDVMASLEQKVAGHADSFEQVYLDSAARYNVKVNPTEERARAEKEANETFAGQQLAWLKANKKLISIEQLPKLQNVIVFDDKDIFRVGSEVAADPQRMKFGSDMVELGKRGQLKEKAGKTRIDTANDRAIKLLEKAAKTKDPAEAEALRAEANALFSATAGKLSGMKFGKNMPSQGLIDRNIAKLPKMSQQPVKRVTEALGDLGGKYLDYAVFTNDLVKRAQALGLGAAKTFADRLAARNAKVSEEERKIEKIADRYASIEDDAKGSGPGSVNEFLFESTRTGKWGYGKYRDAKMGAAFDALGPKAQQFVKDVFAHGDATLSNKKKIVLEATNSEYDAMIKAAQDLVNTATGSKIKADAEKELAKLKAEKAATLKRFQTLFRIREGIPYAPIKRTGAYVVIGESAEYKAAKANKDTATVKKLESDPDHYHVSFVDTKWQARNLSDKLAEQGVFDSPQIVKRSESFDEAFSGEAMLPALTKMRAAVDRRAQDSTGKKDPTAGKLLNIINQLYLEALAEGSARKSEMRRRGVAGEVDMLQSFTQQGRADANFLASVEYEPKIQDALQQMRNQSRTGDRERKSEIFDELTQRYADSLEPKNNSFINGLTNMASKFFLASSPGYYLQNLTQPFMMSLPAMAGRHDYTKAAAELAKAYTELGPLFKDVKLFDQQFDFSKVPADVRKAINDLVNQGKIDIGLATEINEYKVDADGKISQFAQRLNKGMRMAVQKVEATNRLSTAIAAYRLEFARTKDADKATQYAADILTDTHGDYTAFNAPRAFNTQWGKVALQFRKFQLIQIAFYAKLFRDIGRTPEERAVALKTLAYSLGHTAVFAGMMGLPGYAAISFILGLAGDEDEPYDLTADMRKALGPEWADMIMRGAPTVVGMDLSGKIGAGNMLSIMPFSDADLSTTSGQVEAFGAAVGGAALGMATRVADGLLLIAKGDYYKGIERTMPKGVSDALKAARQGAEGMTRRNGDVVLPDSEISALDTVFTALGVPVAEQAVTYERQNRMRDITKNFTERTTRIKNDYAKAVREKDTAAMAEARTAWTKLQQTRQRNGLTPQPVSNLLKAPQEQKAREQRTVGGVQYREGQRKLAESVAEN